MKQFLFLIGILISMNSSWAQEKQNTSVFSRENAFVAGSGTLNFFNGIFIVGINPMYGYFIKDWLDIGVAMNLQYNNTDITIQNLNNGSNRKTFMIGTGISTRIYPVDFLYLQVQPEVNFLSGKEEFFNASGFVSQKFTKLVPSLLVGAGMKRGFQKGRNFAYASILFDVIANKNSPYRSLTGNALGGIVSTTSSNIIPILRFGINISLESKKNN